MKTINKDGFGIVVENLSVTYKNGKNALLNASFKLPTGSIAALVGVNGSGKSTIFKALMGFVPVSSGEISILNMNVKSALKKSIVSYVPQSEEVDWTFPVLVNDVVMMGRYGYMGLMRSPSNNDNYLVENALEKVGMINFRDRQIGELSGGQRQRVFFARSIAQDSKVILLDEPFTGVDVLTEEVMMQLLRDLRDDGKLILVSTHNLGSVPRFCDQTILLKKKVLAYGNTKQIFTRKNLEYAFGGVLRHFILGGSDLHDDNDSRKVHIISDDERPFITYDDYKDGSND